MADFDSLPDVIKPFIDKIKATKKNLVEMTLTPIEEYVWWESRVGGMPYLPLNEPYPIDSEGIPLKLLAQINFAQMPKLANYPEKGLLQFFIGGDDLYGANFEDRQKQADFRIIYRENIIEDTAKLTQDFSAVIAAHSDDYYTPVDQTCAIKYTPTEQYISIDDFQFGQKILGVDNLYDYEDQFEGEDFYDDWVEPYSDAFASGAHCIGGYPFFTQSDPREYEEDIQQYELLLQINSDYEVGILWGDIGVGNFFIHPEDLKKRDFSRVVYNWDCG
ncbi:YwqG family protein [Providencia sp. SP181]|uniref:YwqG family protein n=1 Tax=Providencia sp. SP181 TaxID=3136277 RepID=UPI003D270C0E